MRKHISDEFEINIGEDIHSGLFICDSKRKGATVPEPYDDHRITDWIISEFDLKHFKNYRVKVTVTLLEKKKKV